MMKANNQLPARPELSTFLDCCVKGCDRDQDQAYKQFSAGFRDHENWPTFFRSKFMHRKNQNQRPQAWIHRARVDAVVCWSDAGPRAHSYKTGDGAIRYRTEVYRPQPWLHL